MVSVAVLMALAPHVQAQDVPTGWRVGVAPTAVIARASAQASPSELGIPGMMRVGAGGTIDVSRESGRLPMALLVRWSSHTHGGGSTQFAVDGRSQMIAGALVYRTAPLFSGRLRIEAGGGVHHSRSQTGIAKAGEQFGLQGAPARVLVTEAAPLATGAATLTMLRSSRAEVMARGGVDYVWTRGVRTVLFPVGIRIAIGRQHAGQGYGGRTVVGSAAGTLAGGAERTDAVLRDTVRSAALPASGSGVAMLAGPPGPPGPAGPPGPPGTVVIVNGAAREVSASARSTTRNTGTRSASTRAVASKTNSAKSGSAKATSAKSRTAKASGAKASSAKSGSAKSGPGATRTDASAEVVMRYSKGTSSVSLRTASCLDDEMATGGGGNGDNGSFPSTSSGLELVGDRTAKSWTTVNKTPKPMLRAWVICSKRLAP